VAADRRALLPVGAHLATYAPPNRSEGHVTSSTMSAELGHPVSLAMLERGASRKGERIGVHHLGTTMEAEVVALPFVDPKGARVHG
jgi:sarcosine oxidase subunit alpha